MTSIVRALAKWVPQEQKNSKFYQRLVSIKNNPTYVGRTLRPDTLFAAHVYYWIAVLFNLGDYFRRRKQRNNLTTIYKFPKISKYRGFVDADFSEDEILSKALARCREVATPETLKKAIAKSKKPFLAEIRFNLFKEENRQILALAIHPTIIAAISDYIGTVPVLSAAYIAYSPNKNFEGRSQLFHIDGEDKRAVKCFIPIQKIDSNSGPFTCLPADISQKVYRNLRAEGKIRLRNQKSSDELIYSQASLGDSVEMVGDVGRVFMVDTCRCYHFGSRPSRDSKPRLVLLLHYYSAYSADLPICRKKIKLPPTLDQNNLHDQNNFGVLVMKWFNESIANKRLRLKTNKTLIV